MNILTPKVAIFIQKKRNGVQRKVKKISAKARKMLAILNNQKTQVAGFVFIRRRIHVLETMSL